MEGLLAILVITTIVTVHGKFDPIAFTVSQSTASFTAATTIPFADTIAVHNPATNISKGIFTCKRDGTYKFHAFAFSQSGQRFFLEMYLNNTLLASLYGHMNSEYVDAGNTVIVQLNAGDTVYIKTKGTFTVSLYSLYKENTFTGVELGSQFLYSEEHGAIAFSATSSHNQNVLANTTVKYHTKLVDDGDSLNLSSGVFTAQSSGYYMFHFFSTSRQHEELWLDLRQNGAYVCSIYAFTEFDWASAGNSVILHLSSGDNVGVYSRPGHESHLFGSADHIFTTFSGAQLVSDYDLTNPDTEPVVIFSVGLSKNASVLTGYVVVFDKVFVDLKRAYNPTTGVFVVPVTGLYEFHYHCLGAAKNYVYLTLVKQSSIINGLYGINTAHASSAGNAAILELVGGETVSVKAASSSYLIGAADEVYCTFSGFMLYSTGPSIIIG